MTKSAGLKKLELFAEARVRKRFDLIVAELFKNHRGDEDTDSFGEWVAVQAKRQLQQFYHNIVMKWLHKMNKGCTDKYATSSYYQACYAFTYAATDATK
jgi:hypothetical protein